MNSGCMLEGSQQQTPSTLRHASAWLMFDALAFFADMAALHCGWHRSVYSTDWSQR